MTGPYWTLPIEVGKLEMDMVRVRIPDIPLLRRQREEIVAMLKEIAVNQDEDGRYYVQSKDLGRLGVQSDKRDPEDIVSWHPNVDLKGGDAKDDGFCQALVDAHIYDDLLVAKIKWSGIKQVLLHWILIRGKVADLGFGRLAVVPWRENWWSILAYDLLSRRIDKTKPAEFEAEIRSGLTRPELLAVSTRYDYTGATRRILIPSLHIIPNKVFYRNALRVEARRKEVTGSGYWYSIYNRMNDMVEFGYDSFKKFLAQMCRPFPYGGSGDHRGNNGIPAKWRELGPDLRAGAEAVRIPAAASGNTWKEQERFMERLSPEEAGVSEVPDI